MALVHKDDKEFSTANKKKNLLGRIEPSVRLPVHRKPSYFWGQDASKEILSFDARKGYAEARELIGDGSQESFEKLVEMALSTLELVYEGLGDSNMSLKKAVVEVRLSDELQKWREDQFKLGHKLPGKGNGLTRTSEEVIRVFGAEAWPSPLLINSALFGVGFTNLLIGAYDPETLFSNYCNDMGFYMEHGYHEVFPEFMSLLEKSISDTHALKTFAGKERRAAVKTGLKYIQRKIVLEEYYQAKLANKIAKLNRHEALVLWFCESSLLGTAMEAMTRGYDCAGVIHDFVTSSPGTDVIDIGSDIYNSELMNAFLNTADITESGIVIEENLRRVYDAYAYTTARMFTERWSEPGARMCSLLYTWHMLDDRHNFFRRALLGFPKVRKSPIVQREADFCEVFDPELRTTGFSRLLQNACNGADPCDHVQQKLYLWGGSLLPEFWWLLSTGIIQYVNKGVVCEDREHELAERLKLTMANAYSLGLIDEMTWLMCHASHHAWQVNYLFEAAMFGSLLDDCKLQGKLDRNNY